MRGSAATSSLSASEKVAMLQVFGAFPSLSMTGLTWEWNQTAIENICDWQGTLNYFKCLNGRVDAISMSYPSPAKDMRLTALHLNDNEFWGGLPDMRNLTNLQSISAGNTLIELCAANPAFAPSVTSCYVPNLPNAGSCACKAWYSACDGGSGCTPTVPFASHGTNSFASCNTTSYLLPVFVPCNFSTQPSPAFSCINGVWTATESVTVPVVISNPLIIISGNLSAPITVTNPSTSIIVKECISSNTTITIVLTPAQIEQLRLEPSLSNRLLTQLGANCTESASTILVSAVISGKTCKKVSVRSDVGKSDHASLSVVFRISTSQCNIWWIALASVLGGLAVVGIVGFVLVFKVKPLRRRFLPSSFSTRQATTASK